VRGGVPRRRSRGLEVAPHPYLTGWSWACPSFFDGEQPAGPLLRVRQDVGHEGVVARLGEDELDESALRGLQRERLRAAGSRAAAVMQQVVALEVDGVELAPDDMERAGPVGSGVQHPD